MRDNLEIQVFRRGSKRGFGFKGLGKGCFWRVSSVFMNMHIVSFIEPHIYLIRIPHSFSYSSLAG